MVRRTASAVSVSPFSISSMQLVEEALGERVVGRRAGDGDLVAADVDVAGDRPLDEPEDLVARRRAG